LVKVTDTVNYTNFLKGYDYTLAAELKVIDDKDKVIATITPKDGLKNQTFDFDVPLNIEKKNEDGLILSGAKY